MDQYDTDVNPLCTGDCYVKACVALYLENLLYDSVVRYFKISDIYIFIYFCWQFLNLIYSSGAICPLLNKHGSTRA